jgi:hypothetical protein
LSMDHASVHNPSYDALPLLIHLERDALNEPHDTLLRSI